MSADLAALTHILKRHYGLRDIASGGTYRQVVTLLELERYEARKAGRRRSLKQLAARAGCTVKRTNPLNDIFYRVTPFMALIGGKAPPPKPKTLYDYEVAIDQQGKHGERRSTFRPVEDDDA